MDKIIKLELTDHRNDFERKLEEALSCSGPIRSGITLAQVAKEIWKVWTKKEPAPNN